MRSDTDIRPAGKAPQASRKDFQLPRRMFHMGMGIFAGSVYSLFLSHQQAVYILGTCACVLYVVEQVRINYPELGDRFAIINKYFLRAEEHLKESAAIPYIMALLLTILSFPKSVSLVAIFTLAVADPLSAIVGIGIGKHKIMGHKSLEGSLAFFISTAIISVLVIYSYDMTFGSKMVGCSLTLALIVTLFELIPLRLDDNLTIPLFTASAMWILCGLMGIPTY